MSNVLQYKGYTSRIEYSAEDHILYGKIDGIADLVSFEADSPETIEKEFQAAVDDYLDFCQSIGKEPDKEFKGTFNVRLDPQTHRDLYMYAIRNHTSLNQMVQMACRTYCDRIKYDESLAHMQKCLTSSYYSIAQTETTNPSSMRPLTQTVSSSMPCYIQ